MKFQTLGLKPQTVRKLVKSTEASITILKGSPVVLSNASPTYGYGVKSVEGLAAAEEGFFFGLVAQDIAAGKTGETIFGYAAEARVIVQSRSDTDAVWASTTAIALGDVLAIMTLAGVQAVSRSAAGSALTNPKIIIAAETMASTTTRASSITVNCVGSSSNALLYSTAFKKVFISLM